jgi:DNA replication and repair protein RecF
VFLKEIRLHSFRSYEGVTLDLVPGLNLVVGPNGSGKSNLLEAAAILACGDSHRSAEAKQLFPWEKDAFSLHGVFGGEEDLLVDVRQQRGRPRQVKVNNALQKRLRDWMGRVPVVSFCPDDLDLIKGEPSVRRKALNRTMGQTIPAFADALARFQKVLEERNAALRLVQEGRAPALSLEPWDLSLLKEGAALSIARRDFIAGFSPRVAERHGALSGGEERASLVYKPSFTLPAGAAGSPGEAAEVVAANRRRLQDLRAGELALGTSLIGPHRDDVEILLDDRPARAFGSQGEQRTLAIAVKLAERALLREQLGREPVLLLDDMFSELDPGRRGHLRSFLSNGAQCLVTLTDLAQGEGLSTGAAVLELPRPAAAAPR